VSYCKTEGCLEDAIGNGISDLCPDHEQEACESRFPSDKPDKQEQYYFSDNDYDSCHEIICRELEAADYTRLMILAIKHCPKEHQDWADVLRLTEHLETRIAASKGAE